MEIINSPTIRKANKTHKCMFCCDNIEKGTNYFISTYVNDGDIYRWKCHTYCSEIASKLKMYDHADDYGVSTDDFMEIINGEYYDIMSKTQTDVFNTKEFVFPKFIERLKLVLNYHNIPYNE